MRRPALVLLGFLMSFGVTADEGADAGYGKQAGNGRAEFKRGSEAYSPSALF